MSDKINVKTFLTLILSDAQHLLNKIENRKEDYLYVFSLKRSREQYHEVFACRYPHFDAESLSQLESETLLVVEKFYQNADDLKWYLLYTNDMPPQVEDHLTYSIAQLTRNFQMLELYVQAELSGQSPSSLMETEEDFEFSVPLNTEDGDGEAEPFDESSSD